jgi:hypothetical protein
VSYNRFLSRTFNLSVIEQRRKYIPYPGNNFDPRPYRYKFDRWYQRPLAARKLYWRTHKEQYRQMCEYLKLPRQFWYVT